MVVCIIYLPGLSESGCLKLMDWKGGCLRNSQRGPANGHEKLSFIPCALPRPYFGGKGGAGEKGEMELDMDLPRIFGKLLSGLSTLGEGWRWADSIL